MFRRIGAVRRYCQLTDFASKKAWFDREMPKLAQKFYFEHEEWDAIHEIPHSGTVSLIESLPERPWLIGYPAFCWAIQWEPAPPRPLGVYFFSDGEYIPLFILPPERKNLPGSIVAQKFREAPKEQPPQYKKRYS